MDLTRRTAIASVAAGGIALAASTAQAQRRERHPRIRAAIRALEQAKDEMQHADHDFGGHRVEAIEECDRAIRQLQLALQYDKR